MYKGYLYNVDNRDDFIKSNEIQVFTLPRITSSYWRQVVWERYIREHQGPVAQTLDSAIHRINHYPADKYYGNQLRYPLDSDLSGG